MLCRSDSQPVAGRRGQSRVGRSRPSGPYSASSVHRHSARRADSHAANFLRRANQDVRFSAETVRTKAAFGREQIFHADRDTMKRSPMPALPDLTIGLSRLFQCKLFGEGDPSSSLSSLRHIESGVRARCRPAGQRCVQGLARRVDRGRSNARTDRATKNTDR
jgi:hypothetical protein